MTMTLFDMPFDALARDAHYDAGFLDLHAGDDAVLKIDADGFHHACVVRPIPDSPYADLETPWGYGGPLAKNSKTLANGLRQWSESRKKDGHIAEFVRIHPFINPAPYQDIFDHLVFDRETVLVDLQVSSEDRLSGYDRTARRRIRRAGEALTIRPLGPKDAGLFQFLLDEGLSHNKAGVRYFFDTSYFKRLLSADWADGWAAEANGVASAVLCAVHGGGIAHTLHSGGDSQSRQLNASYLLHHHAIEHYAANGIKWMHLGGGRTNNPDDALLDFKSKFSPLKANFYVGGMIHDRDAFAALGGRKGTFFLSYRQAQAS